MHDAITEVEPRAVNNTSRPREIHFVFFEDKEFFVLQSNNINFK